MRILSTVAALAVFAAASAAAQAPDPQAPGEIVVHAQRSPDQVSSFVHSVSAVMPVGQMARWNQDICPGVVGADQTQAQHIIDQIAIRAMAVGLHVGRSGCNANLTIIVTGDADNFAQAIYLQREPDDYCDRRRRQLRASHLPRPSRLAAASKRR
jgi:hypothetical protein